MSKLIAKILSKLFGLIYSAVPRKKNYYAFYPLHDLTKISGNSRAMILYLKKHHQEIAIVLITKNSEVKKEAKNMGIQSATPFFGFSWALIRAEFIFLDSNWFPKLYSPKMKIIQLWHGVGFKNIALLDDNLTTEEKNSFEFYYRKYHLLISSSENDFKKKAASFHSPNIAITGSPRNDVLFADSNYIVKIKKKYHLEKYTKIITYAPTFRDFETIAPFSEPFWQTLQQQLEKTNQVFVVKKHPMDAFLKVPTHLANIQDLSQSISDTQELLLISDLLISDYSSIFTDFVLTKKPILAYVYDFENYKKNCRSIYYDLEEILPKTLIYTEVDLIEKIKDTQWTADELYLKSYQIFKGIFHQHSDDKSSQRVMKEISKLKNS